METNNITKKLQLIEVNMLRDFMILLEKNNFPFFLAYGTALGCARHKGFIPWDDDIDIFILGKDYPKLQEIFRTQDTGYLKLHDFSTVKGYPYVFPKVIDSRTVLKEKLFEHLDYECGVYIDVFPLYSVPNSKIGTFISSKTVYFKYAIVKANYINLDDYSFVYRQAIKVIRKLFNVYKIQNKLFVRYGKELKKSEYYMEPLEYRNKMKKKYFLEPIFCEFEGILMPMSSMYHDLLTDFYGEYMKLPPEKDRVPSHNFVKLNL